jgi:nucleoside-diphosphate-sugar epimerase
MIPGDGKARHCFICIQDVANFLSGAACGGPSGVYDIGGPEALTFADIVHLHEKILGAKLRIKQTPAWIFKIAAAVLGTFSPAAGNLMFLNYVAATARHCH